jgi:hypothetical protein
MADAQGGPLISVNGFMGCFSGGILLLSAGHLKIELSCKNTFGKQFASRESPLVD